MLLHFIQFVSYIIRFKGILALKAYSLWRHICFEGILAQRASDGPVPLIHIYPYDRFTFAPAIASHYRVAQIILSPDPIKLCPASFHTLDQLDWLLNPVPLPTWRAVISHKKIWGPPSFARTTKINFLLWPGMRIDHFLKISILRGLCEMVSHMKLSAAQRDKLFR